MQCIDQDASAVRIRSSGEIGFPSHGVMSLAYRQPGRRSSKWRGRARVILSILRFILCSLSSSRLPASNLLFTVTFLLIFASYKNFSLPIIRYLLKIAPEIQIFKVVVENGR